MIKKIKTKIGLGNLSPGSQFYLFENETDAWIKTNSPSQVCNIRTGCLASLNNFVVVYAEIYSLFEDLPTGIKFKTLEGNVFIKLVPASGSKYNAVLVEAMTTLVGTQCLLDPKTKVEVIDEN